MKRSIRPILSGIPFASLPRCACWWAASFEEFNLAYAVIALLPFLFIFKMQKRERSWIAALCAIYLCIGVLLMILLNPNVDRSSSDLIRVFFASSHAIVAIMVGYGLALTAAYMATNYQQFRRWGLAGGVIIVVLALYCLLDSASTLYAGLAGNISLSQLPHYVAQSFAKNQYGLPVIAGLILVTLALLFVMALVVYRKRAPLAITLGIFALMPLHPGLSHWFESEQRGHMFGYWFGHDMFTPPFKAADKKPIYPEMAKDAILFGGTDPGRFCPTYMVFCESFTPHDCQPPEDQKFDRRDVYVITQNALADGTYLCYIRAHYNRSKQIDPPFFQELLHTSLVSPLDTAFTRLGARIEQRRRTSTSLFTENDFTNFPALVAKLRPTAGQDALSKWLYENLSKETQDLLGAQGAESARRTALAKDLNKLIAREFDARKKLQSLSQEKDALDLKAAVNSSASVRRDQDELAKEMAQLSQVEPLYTPNRFARIKVPHYLAKFIEENPQGSTRIRLNRLLLEEAYPGEIAKSLGGIYPDREIYIPTPQDSQQCFQEYMADAQRRKMMNPPQLKPGEVVEIVGDHVQVSGQTAVMSINGLLTKVIFDQNPENEFYVEESFPLDWMYPYLEPYGIIMKINRRPLASISEAALQKDHDFWKQYSTRLSGDFIDYDTSVKQVADWIEKTYLEHNLDGFTGDRKFVRDNDAQKAFSKLRSSIANSIYAWRLNPQCPPEYRPKTQAETQRLFKEANFAFMQAFAFCPYSPEAVFHYVNLLVQFNRFDDALLVAETCHKLDPFNPSIDGLLANLQGIRQQQEQQHTAVDQNKSAIKSLEDSVRTNPNNYQAVLVLADAYQQMQQPERSAQLLDSVLNSTNTDANVLIATIQGYVKLQSWAKTEQALQKLTQLTPENPEAWYDFAVLKATLNKPEESIRALTTALGLNAKRLQRDPKSRDLQDEARKQPQFAALRQMPEFKKLVPDAK